MCFTRPSIPVVLLAFAHAVASHNPPVGLLGDLGAARRMVEMGDVNPEHIVTFRWDAYGPDSILYLSNPDLFVPLATSLVDKIRADMALRTVPIEHKDMYSFPENLLLLLIRIAKQPIDGNKPWELSTHHPIILNYLNAEMETSLEAKDVELASRLRSLPLNTQTEILGRVSIPRVETLSKLFKELRADDKLRRLIWQEMQLLSYFSPVDRKAFRDLHLDDTFLRAIVRAHSIESKRTGGKAWYGGMSMGEISLSDELADRIVPAKLSPLADYYQDYDRLLNEGNGELKERLDRFLFTHVMSLSSHVRENKNTARTFVPRLTELPNGWWLPSSQTSIEGVVRPLIDKLFESLHSDFITVTTAINEKNEKARASGVLSALSYPDTDPYTAIHGRQASVLARYQAIRHLCKYSGIDMHHVFLISFQDPRAVRRWLAGLSRYWSVIDNVRVTGQKRKWLDLGWNLGPHH
ncbi:uncharacterized protein MELLADRAFT_69141 [Melampsora larici-populina 98AG31]|uniref:Secreted protein n=1 Tax=Melampsora larici-populina (strain 98AG31 / pathotype 3-4-7) TaxID=747676 RepID=F4S9J5_MELLP|nr:uncharacterized protein MELLADRAFT_69141 [Melampsora larici-populina 98AG31]EGF98689.1 hypothetical protein MELLADRAFT_69141 [Melampsora larici-populina 98AG31]